jgi:quercetin dioxygenase-like cupin family protein
MDELSGYRRVGWLTRRVEEVGMRIKPGITLAVFALVTSGMGCSKQKSESGNANASDSARAVVSADTVSQPALQWGPAPAVFPAGAKMAVVSGDPSKAELFEVELAMPDGYKIPPHFHPTDEAVEVKEGTFLVGLGDKLDPKKTNPMKQGDKGSLRAKMHHFAIAQGPTIVAVTARGPFAMTYVNPADDPQKKGAKP